MGHSNDRPIHRLSIRLPSTIVWASTATKHCYTVCNLTNSSPRDLTLIAGVGSRPASLAYTLTYLAMLRVGEFHPMTSRAL